MCNSCNYRIDGNNQRSKQSLFYLLKCWTPLWTRDNPTDKVIADMVEKIMKHITFAVLVLLLWCGSGWATDYYVTQLDNGDGTVSCAAGESVANFNAGSLADNIFDNDTIYLCGTITTAITIPDGGTAGNVVTVRGDAPGNAGIVDIAGASSSCINTNDKDYVTITNLTVKDGGWNTDNNRALDNGGIFVTTNSDHITISGCTVYNDLDGSDEFGNGITIRGSDVTVSSNHIYEIQDTEQICVGGANNGLACVIAGDCPDGSCIHHECDGIYIQSTAGSNYTITGNTIDQTIDRNGISVVDATSTTLSSNIIDISDGTDLFAGIDIEPDAGLTVTTVSVTGNSITMPSVASTHGIQVYNNGVGAEVTGATISNNTVNMTTPISTNECIFITTTDANPTVSGNVVSNAFIALRAYDAPATFTGNYITGSNVGFRSDTNTHTVEFNKNYIDPDDSQASAIGIQNFVGAGTVNANYNIINTGKTGIRITSGACTLNAYNNTLYGQSDKGISMDTGTLTAKNNIISSSDVSFIAMEWVGGTLTSNYNLYYHTGDSTVFYCNGNTCDNWVDWQTDNGTCDCNQANDATGIDGSDPLFHTAGSNFHLTSTSPAKDVGTNVNLTLDFDSVPVPQGGYDIGAFEYIEWALRGATLNGALLP